MTQSDFHKMSPCSIVDWRWQRAGHLLAGGLVPDQSDDGSTARAWQFRRAASEISNAQRLRACDAELYDAEAIHLRNDPQRWEIEARLIAGQDSHNIGRTLELSPDLVQTYALSFFDVGGRLDAHDWVELQAVRIGPWGNPLPDEAGIWRFVAWHYPPALDLLVQDFYAGPGQQNSAPHALAARIRSLVQLICTPLTDLGFQGMVQGMIDDVISRAANAPSAELAEALTYLKLLRAFAAKESSRRRRAGRAGATPRPSWEGAKQAPASAIGFIGHRVYGDRSPLPEVTQSGIF